eukprot:jgi/Botrbrau1/7805/Bobra.0159s0233.1
MKKGKSAMLAAGHKRFCDMPEISQRTLEVLSSMGFEFATPVQEAVIPLFCGHKDVAVDACTGSGKTLAFVVPLIEKLRHLDEPLKKFQVGGIIVSPTRELARQIHEVAQPFVASVPGLTSALYVGGSDPTVDAADFRERGGKVLVGTPGRLADVMKRCPGMELKRVEVLVLDEADRLLHMGFQQQLDNIMSRLPKQRRTGLFSATQTEAVQALARAGLRNPIRVNVAVKARDMEPHLKGLGSSSTQKTPTGLTIQYTICTAAEKFGRLIQFLQEHRGSKTIVYMLTCACVDFFATVMAGLPQTGAFPLVTLHGRMKQSVREAHLADFAAGSSGCLLCTDVAARGLDIPDVDWIVQYDPPQDPDAFVHRVGRTARMGRSGNALVMLLPTEETYVDFLKVRKIPLQSAPEWGGEAPDLAPALRRMSERDRDVLQKGTRAFVSFVRGYREHHCRFIFRTQELPLAALAMSYGLLRLPKMPEIGSASLAGFEPSPVDPDTVKFKDKAREKQRRKLLAARAAEAGPSAGAQQNKQQPKGEPQKATVQVRKGPHGTAGAPADKEDKVRRLPSVRRRKLNQRQDAEDLQDEYRLVKKLKKGKLSQHAFDVAMGLAAEESGGEGEAQPLSESNEGAGEPEAQKLKGGHSHRGGPPAFSAGTAAESLGLGPAPQKSVGRGLDGGLTQGQGKGKKPKKRKKGRGGVNIFR